MLTRDLVPIVDMRTLRLKSRHICNVIYIVMLFSYTRYLVYLVYLKIVYVVSLDKYYYYISIVKVAFFLCFIGREHIT